MIKHIVIWKLKQQANGNNKQRNAEIIKEKLEALNGVIPGLLSLEVGIDVSNTDMSGDVVLYSTFASQQALQVYQQHPDHQLAAEFIKSATAQRQVVDYEMTEL